MLKNGCNQYISSRLLLSWVLPIVLAFLAAGCAATTSSMLKDVGTVEVCLNGERSPASGRFTKDELIGGLLMMLKSNENSEAVLCSSGDNYRVCKREKLLFFVQGGPIPGVGSFKKPYLTQVGLDKKTSQIKLKMDAVVRWMATPVFCQDAYTEITVSSTEQIVIESKSVCTWTVFPNVWNMKFAVGFIDFDNSVIAGNYAVSVGGLPVIGGGSGRFILRFARKNTLVTQHADGAAEKAALIPVGQLPSRILAAPTPTHEVTKKSKGEIDPAERSLWESVSKMNTADGYIQYLSHYPEGRFYDVARANLRVIEEREAQNRELSFWRQIKDSTDPNDFESYMSKYPKGLFVDLASVRIQRLKVVATQAAAIDAELALWDQVKGSTDVNEIEVYLKHYPAGRFADIARNRINKLTAVSKEMPDLEMEMWNKVKNSRKISDFQNFLEVFPDGIYAGIAKSRIDNLIRVEEENEELAFWNNIKDSANPGDFDEYLHRYPKGQYADHARRLSRNLASLIAERKELEIWENVKDSKNPDDFDLYIAKYPEGRFTKIARERREAAALAKSMAKIDFGRYHALVIGNNDYQHLKNLVTATNDAKAVASLLKQAYGFEVKRLTNATRKQIIDALSSFRRILTKNDNLLIYFAGHGWLDRDAGRGYWLPVDSERDSPANWISTSDISDALKAMAAKHVMVVADSCYSGTLSRAIKLSIPSSGYFRRMATKRTRVALTSGGLEPVLDDGSHGYSVFAGAFLKALETNRGVLEGTRLFNQLRRDVILNAPQTPEYSDILYTGHEGGDFLFVRRQ
jgi:hypothetical protein